MCSAGAKQTLLFFDLTGNYVISFSTKAVHKVPVDYSLEVVLGKHGKCHQVMKFFDASSSTESDVNYCFGNCQSTPHFYRHWNGRFFYVSYVHTAIFKCWWVTLKTMKGLNW
jgi:hypothetical protein